MNALLDMATRDFRYADLSERLGQHDEAKRIREEARGLLADMPCPTIEERQCNGCGETWPDNGNPEWPFCKSANTNLVETEEEE